MLKQKYKNTNIKHKYSISTTLGLIKDDTTSFLVVYIYLLFSKTNELGNGTLKCFYGSAFDYFQIYS